MVQRPDQAAIETDNLTKTFGSFTAVDHVSFRVEQGEIFGFLGPNGAGKTTVIRILCGILLPTSGNGRVLGFDVASQSEQVKARIGYMSQKFALYNDLTVRENLEFYAGLYNVPAAERKPRIAELIAVADLTGRERELAAHLAGGWKQRLALGCAMVHRPPILFLDEPTAGVDPVSRREFWDMIYGLAGSGVTVFVTTHYMDEAEHCNTIGLMYGGRLIAEGNPDELKATRMAGELLEVDAEPMMDALDGLLEMKGTVREAALYGNLLHVAVNDAAGALDAIPRTLASRGVIVHRIERIAPALEDVFVSLIDAQTSASTDGS